MCGPALGFPLRTMGGAALRDPPGHDRHTREGRIGGGEAEVSALHTHPLWNSQSRRGEYKGATVVGLRSSTRTRTLRLPINSRTCCQLHHRGIVVVPCCCRDESVTRGCLVLGRKARQHKAGVQAGGRFGIAAPFLLIPASGCRQIGDVESAACDAL